MDTRNSLSRRQVVGAAAGAFSACALAACGGGNTSATSTTPSAAGESTSSTPAGGQGTDLVKLSAVPVGGAVKVESPAGPTIVAQPAAGKVVAFSAKCTHKGVALNVDGTDLVCPAHGSVFEAMTGKVVKGPATVALPAVAGVKVEGPEVVVS